MILNPRRETMTTCLLLSLSLSLSLILLGLLLIRCFALSRRGAFLVSTAVDLSLISDIHLT